ncbi:ribosome hibernation-promoting factor, HPF/YfiA family [Camelimonas abortus]|uniref:Ribosome hibernation promoting factor n=1 Tax=Camelimonas abortus TaxID=1017184 RepID=A0ABV7LBK0_9HYPH
MTLRVSGKNMDIGSAFRGQIEVRVNAAVEKYFGVPASGHVTVTRDGGAYRTDCGLHLRGVTLESTGFSHDPVMSFDQAAERIEKRLRRYSARLKSRQTAGDARTGVLAGERDEGVDEGPTISATVFAPPGEEEDGEEFHPVVVAEVTNKLRTMPVSEAVTELDLTGAPILLFRHAGTSRLNIVYRRNDGTIGWIDPNLSDGA